jgi:hypothetical protein
MRWRSAPARAQPFTLEDTMSLAAAVNTIEEMTLNVVVPSQNFILTIEANTHCPNIADWIRRNRRMLETWLFAHGAILFRDFECCLEDFGQIARSADIVGL